MVFMFLTKPVQNDGPSNMVEFLEAIHENEMQMHNNTVAMMRLEHESIITENADLLQEGIMDYLKKAKDLVMKFFKMIKDFIVKMFNKAKDFINKLFGKNPPKEEGISKIKMALKISALASASLLSIFVSRGVYKSVIAGTALFKLYDYERDVKDLIFTLLNVSESVEESEKFLEDFWKKWGDKPEDTFKICVGEKISKSDIGSLNEIKKFCPNTLESFNNSVTAFIKRSEENVSNYMNSSSYSSNSELVDYNVRNVRFAVEKYVTTAQRVLAATINYAGTVKFAESKAEEELNKIKKN